MTSVIPTWMRWNRNDLEQQKKIQVPSYDSDDLPQVQLLYPMKSPIHDYDTKRMIRVTEEQNQSNHLTSTSPVHSLVHVTIPIEEHVHVVERKLTDHSFSCTRFCTLFYWCQRRIIECVTLKPC